LRDIESNDLNNSAIVDAPTLLKLLKISKLLKMLKLLRVMKLKKLLLKFEEYIVTDSMDLIVTFVNIFLKIVIVAHYMACLFFYVGIQEMDSKGYAQGWLHEEE